jgi:hypothetical protein
MKLLFNSFETPAGSNLGEHYHILEIQSSASDDGWKHRPKHVELTLSNKLIYIMHFVGYFHSCVTMHGSMNVKITNVSSTYRNLRNACSPYYSVVCLVAAQRTNDSCFALSSLQHRIFNTLLQSPQLNKADRYDVMLLSKDPLYALFLTLTVQNWPLSC